jgi:hypothetical protein
MRRRYGDLAINIAAVKLMTIKFQFESTSLLSA